MYNSIALSLGEMVLKGKNRGFFEGKLNKQINKVIKKYGLKYYRDRGKIFIDTEENIDEVSSELKNIFGIVYITKCVKIKRDIETIKKTAVEYLIHEREKREIKTFKVIAKRSDKKYEIKSMDMNRMLGGEILNNIDDIKVDVHNPDININIDIRDYCYIFSEKISGTGGLPAGTNGKGLILLSGGIDSPVAAYIMARRGVEIHALTFHADPYTSLRAFQKTVDLSSRLALFCGQVKLYSVNLLEIYQEIKGKCKEDESTIISRRFMMRIAEKIATENGFDFLITGECLGQVASQTALSLSVIDRATEMPVLRPLIGMDKTEIINIARDIGTYEISIEPYEDCCSVFSPERPQTKPKKYLIEKSEEKLDIEGLISSALETLQVEEIN